jgi:hypothetical protein
MASMGFEPDVKVRVKDYRIGCIGAGMIMAECHLAAHAQALEPCAPSHRHHHRRP